MPVFDRFGNLRISGSSSSDITTDYPLKYMATITSSRPTIPNGLAVFDVTGAIQIFSFIGYVTRSLLVGPAQISSSFTSSVYNAKTDLSTTTQIGTAPAGFLMNLIQGGNNVFSGSGQVENVGAYATFMNSGTLVVDTNVNVDGEFMFYMLYQPVDSGSVVNPRF